MRPTRRHILQGAAATAGTAFLPFRLNAQGGGGDTVITDTGTVSIYPVQHASFAMQSDWGTVYLDPVGGADLYADLMPPDLILVTHQHGDHYDEETLIALSNGVPIGVDGATYDMFSDTLKERATIITHDVPATFRDFAIQAIPAYNTTEDRLNFHPRERNDNGYIVTLPNGFRMYASGDTEDIPEMRALENIDLAFVCMNLPFTMTAEQAASAVNEFAPRVCYPYHYRGREGGTQDPAQFAQMVEEAATRVRLGGWY